MTVEKVKVGYSLTPGAIIKLQKAHGDTGLGKSQILEMLIRSYLENFVRTHNKA